MGKVKGLLIGVAACFAAFGGMLMQPPLAESIGGAAQPKKEKMQFYADEQFNIEGTDTIVMLHNVVLHHNGAVVVCDSAVRYSASKFECFTNVIINQDSTYIYCQRATYDRDSNTAQVYDDLIKVISGTAELYTYNCSFNTLDNIGRYWGGGTMLQDSNRLESDRGWFYTKENNIYAAGGVQLTDPDYDMISDSVRYNTSEQVAEFYTQSYIWNSKGEMLSASKGLYFHKSNTCDFTENAYLLTAEQELWADSLTYNSATEDAVARSNIQMRDEENQSMAFGDYGEYHGLREEGFLTRNPSVANFDREAPEDTLFMRSDSMFIFSVPWDSVLVEEVIAPDAEEPMVRQELRLRHLIDSIRHSDDLADEMGVRAEMEELSQWHGAPEIDTLSTDSLREVTIVNDSIADSIPPHDSLQRVILAYNNVRMWRRDFQAVCDSMVGFSKDSTAHMYIDPVLWNENNQLTASLIDIYTRNEQLERAVFTGNPLMVAEVEGLDYNQIKGLRMESHFRDNEIYQHHVEGNAQTLYYMVDEGETKPHTLMIINSSTVTFLIDSQQVVKINWGGQNDYVGYPIDDIPDDVERFFEGFKWEAERRPTRADVFDRVIKPSQRESYATISRPQFPITQRIEEHKRRLIAAKTWEDRYELLPQKALDWLEQNVNFEQK